jgi:hypothetical protein
MPPADDGLVVLVKLTPRARRARIEGMASEPGPQGPRPVLKLSVTAPPEDGKANAAMIELLARSWRVPKSAFTIIGGATHRLKRVAVRGPAPLIRRLHQQLGAA